MNQTYITNPEKGEDRFEETPLIAQNVIKVYNKLHKSIDEVNSKVQHVISKNQSQFLFAYKNHISKIQKQLGQIKKKSEQQQKMFSANDRIKYLEKQISVFRQQSLRVYEKLEKTSNQLDIYKRKYEDAIRMYENSEKSMRYSIKKQKLILASHLYTGQKIHELQLKLQAKDEQIQKLKQELQAKNKGTLLGSIDSGRVQKSQFERLKSSTMKNTEMKSIKSGESIVFEDNFFRDLFFECVRQMKRKITFRKNGVKLNLRNIQTLQQFRSVDKIELLSLFFCNQKLQSWLYQKLFPNKFFDKIQEHTKNSTLYKNNETGMTTTQGGFLLPKMREMERKRYGSKLQEKNLTFL